MPTVVLVHGTGVREQSFSQMVKVVSVCPKSALDGILRRGTVGVLFEDSGG